MVGEREVGKSAKEETAEPARPRMGFPRRKEDRASQEMGEVRWKSFPAPQGNRGSQEGRGKSGGMGIQARLR